MRAYEAVERNTGYLNMSMDEVACDLGELEYALERDNNCSQEFENLSYNLMLAMNDMREYIKKEL